MTPTDKELVRYAILYYEEMLEEFAHKWHKKGMIEHLQRTEYKLERLKAIKKELDIK